MRPNDIPPLLPAPVRIGAAAALVTAILSAVACAGGDSSGIGSGGSGGVTSPLANGPTPAPAPAPATPVPGVGVGAIAGFGSIVVNGVAWDETTATITGDDGGPSDRAMLLLGRQVSVSGDIDPTTGRGRATAVTIRRALAGVVDRFDTSGRPVVLGLPVGTDVGTSWGGTLTASTSVRVGDRLEVYGVVAPDQSLVRASRVEPSLYRFSLREGFVSATRGDRCGFSLGTLVVDCSHAAIVPTGTIANGSRVRVSASRDASAGTLVVDRVDLIAPPAVTAGSRVSAEGRIAAISGSVVTVEGMQFDVSQASVTGAPSTGLAVGLEVEVSGLAGANGIIAAAVLKVETDDQTIGREFEATGAISMWAGPTSFVVRGVRIDGGGAKISGGTVLDLANGVTVAVHGRLVDAVVKAEEIEIKH